MLMMLDDNINDNDNDNVSEHNFQSNITAIDKDLSQSIKAPTSN